MAAPALQRSVDTFRRSGSSGLVWGDRFFSEDLSQLQQAKTRKQGPDDQLKGLRQSHSVGSTPGQAMAFRSRRISGGGSLPYGGSSTMQVDASPATADPPSPKLPVCGIFGLLRNASTASRTGKTCKPGRR